MSSTKHRDIEATAELLLDVVRAIWDGLESDDEGNDEQETQTSQNTEKHC